MGTGSYLPRDTLCFISAEDQPGDAGPIWLRVRHLPLGFHRDQGTGRWWAWIEGTRLGDDGDPLNEVTVHVWLSALPRHEPRPDEPIRCGQCDPPERWPCPPAKARLLAEHEGDRNGLAYYLARQLCATGPARSGETPREAYQRIVGWTWDEPARHRLAIR